MSIADRAAERAVADFYDESVRDDSSRAPRHVKRFGEAFLTGLALGAVARKILR